MGWGHIKEKRMIPQNLKVGDTFKDEELTYRVTKVLEDNMYESELIDEEKPLVFTETKEEAKSDLSSVPYAQLKKLCAEKGLDATGSKTDLIARLEG